MKVVVAGGTGQVGTLLARALHREGHEVTALGRHPARAAWRIAAWDPLRLDGWPREIDGADVVVNLAGRSVNCRYTLANRRDIFESRTRSVAAIGRAILMAERPPAVWLQASTATIYAHTYGPPHDETTGVIGGQEPHTPDTWKFSIDVATAWERAFDAADVGATRKVALRSAMIMSPDAGGIFDTLLGLVRRGLGGTSGDGRQYLSWIHDVDFVRALEWIIARPQFSGPVNIASPSPLPNKVFMTELRRAWGTSIGLPASRWMLEIGAFLMRTESELALKSRRVVPGRLLQDGFVFTYPDWPAAARDLCRRWREGR
ncbi:MAG: DUF1731 domain-containing protein [Acidobacteriota bacterium]